MNKFDKLCESYLNSNYEDIIGVFDSSDPVKWKSGETVFDIYKLLTPKERGDLFSGALPQMWTTSGKWHPMIDGKDRKEIGDIIHNFVMKIKQ